MRLQRLLPLLLSFLFHSYNMVCCGQSTARPSEFVVQNAETPAYILGSGDQLTVSVANLEDFNEKTFLIDVGGDVNLPITGKIYAAGITTQELQEQIAHRLEHIVKRPDVTVSLAIFGSQPVSVLGAVSQPGVKQLEGNKNLYEVLSICGGLRADAGNIIHITRKIKWGMIPLLNAKADLTGSYSMASVRVKDVVNGDDPSGNILVKPGDVVSVPKAEMVYAVGSVTKPGGFLLTENETISTLQVLSLAEGLQKTAAPSKARILRAVSGSAKRVEIPVDVKELMAGKTADIPLQSNDILFIPNSSAKSAGYRTIDALLSSVGAVVYASRY